MLRRSILPRLMASARIARAPMAKAPTAVAPTARAPRPTAPIVARPNATCAPEGERVAGVAVLVFIALYPFPVLPQYLWKHDATQGLPARTPENVPSTRLSE